MHIVRTKLRGTGRMKRRMDRGIAHSKFSIDISLFLGERRSRKSKSLSRVED